MAQPGQKKQSIPPRNNRSSNTKRRSGGSVRLKTFQFEGTSQLNNEAVRGEVQAVNEQEARRQLLYRNIKVVSLKQGKRKARKIKPHDITVFTRQLGSMLKAGLTLTQALTIIGRGNVNTTMANMVLAIRNDVEQGSSFTEALSRYPKYFDNLYLGMIEAGEGGGVLETSLDRISIQREKSAAMASSVRKALIYPVFVILVAVVVMTFMLVWILPAFKSLYEEMGATLPQITLFVIALSDFLVKWGLLIAVLIALAVYLFINRYRNSTAFKESVTRFLMKMPVIGYILQRSETARWARTFASLYGAGLPMTEILDLITKGSKNILFEKATHQIEAQVSQGESLVSSMRSLGSLFPPLFIQLAEVGEEAGTLDDMMGKAAEYFEDEVDRRVSTLESVFEPMIIVVLAVFVGFILLAMYLPIFNMAATV